MNGKKKKNYVVVVVTGIENIHKKLFKYISAAYISL